MFTDDIRVTRRVDCRQMPRTAVDQTWTAAALYLVLILSHLVGEGSVVTVACRPGQRVTLPCSYGYEDGTLVSQLSVQWRSPRSELLCHYIKHKAYENCTAGYAISYRPGSIALTIQQVRPDDFGTHICSVSKRHEFSDYNVELTRMSDSVTSAPTGGVSQSGVTWRLFILHALLCLFVYM